MQSQKPMAVSHTGKTCKCSLISYSMVQDLESKNYYSSDALHVLSTARLGGQFSWVQDNLQRYPKFYFNNTNPEVTASLTSLHFLLVFNILKFTLEGSIL